ncbi:sensor histidine kinase [Flagellimonas algicola]|uniref:Two component regulator three Y domain-containing protein n=1 Tax=Flagellimonas algicola TaxID=2583815 RepID=A0ABY2WR95_9FLAO|nr:sensor histidine kinase [Allomuricauda algicola]TMU57528.1 hypothetical protein FGG15_08290 [Allomuricauda algicola]
MRAYLSTFLTALLFVLGPYLFGQRYHTTRYADDSGLPSRIVNDVIQDQQGFIWVAGNNGLYKFDGKKFNPHLASLKDTLGLRDNKITSLIQAKDGKMWIGTAKGLHLMQGDSIRYFQLLDEPTDSQDYVLNVFEDRNENLWIGTYGGLFLVEKSKKATHFFDGEGQASVSKTTIWRTTEDNQGRLWIATKNGPFVMDSHQDFQFKKVKTPLLGSLQDLEALDFFGFRQYNDSIMLVESNKGILKGVIDGSRSMRISKFLDESGKELEEHFIENFMITPNGDIWAATWKKNFKKYRYQEGRLLEQSVISKNGLLNMSGNSKSVFEDKQGSIWITNTNGLYKLSRTREEVLVFPSRYEADCLSDFYGIYSIKEDHKSNLWITTSTKLYRIKKQEVLEGKCPEAYLVFEDGDMQLSRDINIDSQNRLWIGADGGLFVTQLDSKQRPGPFHKIDKSDGLPSNWSYDVLEIAKDTFWVGNYTGLVRMILPEGNFKKPEIEVFTSEEDKPNSLVNSQAMDLEWDRAGNLWIGTFNGVSRLSKGENKGYFENYTHTFGKFEGLSHNSVKKIFRDSGDRLWIATQRGLNLYRPDINGFYQFGHAEGLPSEYILGIQEDSKGFLWICTTNGVLRAKYNVSGNQFVERKHYTSQTGLADNIPYRNSIWIDDGDNVFIGSREGISVIGNHLTETQEVEFDLVLIASEVMQKGTHGFTSIPDGGDNGQIKLSHKENTIRIDYRALDFTQPENLEYRHKLLPGDDAWVFTGANPELTYYNLPPGDYQLVLDGSNSVGKWSESPITLDFSIAPPFWRSTWAYVLYVVLLAGILRFFYLMRIGKKERELEQKAQLEQALMEEREQLRKDNAADFHDELGSMITKISLFLEMAQRQLEENKDPLPFFNKIRNNLKGLSGGFRDLLWVIDPQKDSLEDTFIRLKDFGEEFFDKSQVTFTSSPLIPGLEAKQLSPKSKKQAIMIFKEAMTNSLKYAKATQAQLNLICHNDWSTLEFKDNGVGFNVAQKSKGRGLKNMRARATKIEAELEILSSTKGTIIRLDRIPHTGDTNS